jgi:catechol 1,2-dioxygenase
MIVQTHEEVTADALVVMARTNNPRLREIMMAFVKHLHAFVREVRLTEAEFREATAIIDEMGSAPRTPTTKRC